jgi:hypothetical protein
MRERKVMFETGGDAAAMLAVMRLRCVNDAQVMRFP